MSALDEAARRWGGQPAVLSPNGDVRTVESARRAPAVPTPEEIASWGGPGQDLSQMVTDSGGVPAGPMLWSSIPQSMWYPNGGPAGDIQAFINGQVFGQFEPIPPTPPVAG